jgi:pimeloyl-ACP methyl ester carboxylesterase/DNA-binding CsgD family transcriptional regulator
MDAPPVQYVKTSDGYDIAYRVSGHGPPLVFVPPPFSHLQIMWLEDYRYVPWFERLSSRFQLVTFDPRGMGMSSRGLPPDHSLADWQHDLETLVDHLGLERFILLGALSGSHVAIGYAVEHPERLDALILLSTSIKLSAFPAALFQALPAQNWELFLSTLVGKGLSAEESQRAVARLARSITPTDWETCARALYKWDVSDNIGRVRSPTLILHPRDYVTLRSEEGMKAAAAIDQSQFALTTGDTMLGDAQEGVDAIGRFLAELPARSGESQMQGDRRPSTLSSREVEVLRLLAAGKSNQQIADELVISLNTVRRHVSNVFDKTGAANRTQAAAYARDHGLA